MISRGERVAAIDVGSNTILLTVAEYDPNSGLTTLEEGEEQPRLGAGVSATGLLSEEAMDRALRALCIMRGTCQRWNVRRIGAVATAAVREARNGAEFVRRVRALDIPLRIISPEIEAALSYRSAAYRFPTTAPMLVADIGGGSLELVGAAEGVLKLSTSLLLGAVRLTEMTASLPELRHHARHALSSAISPTEWSNASVIGSGGTFATLASIVVAARGASAQGIHGTEVSAAEVEQLLQSLAEMTPDQRRRVPGLKPERADIIVAGLAIIAELLSAVGAGGVKMSGFGLRDGLLLDMLVLGYYR